MLDSKIEFQNFLEPGQGHGPKKTCLWVNGIQCTDPLENKHLLFDDQDNIIFGAGFPTDCHNEYTTMCAITIKWAEFAHDPTKWARFFPPHQAWYGADGCFRSAEWFGKYNQKGGVYLNVADPLIFQKGEKFQDPQNEDFCFANLKRKSKCKNQVILNPYYDPDNPTPLYDNICAPMPKQSKSLDKPPVSTSDQQAPDTNLEEATGSSQLFQGK